MGLLLLAGMAAAQSFPGGLPRCLRELNTCNTNLGTCTTELGACEADLGTCSTDLNACTADLTEAQDDLATCTADLAACQAEPNAVFPGDGAGHGAALSYMNNGDGTATDNNTGLMWEVKDDAGGVHDVANTYTWTSTPGGTAANGTLFTEFLDTLNNKCDGDVKITCTIDADCSGGIGNGKCGRAGFRDWRIPHIKELQSIVDYGVAFPGPAIDPTFPGLTAASDYWSSTEIAGSPSIAWHVFFDNGNVGDALKNFALRGRAVRGGQ